MSDNTDKKTATGLFKTFPSFLKWDAKRAVFAFLFALLVYYAVNSKTETKEETVQNVKVDFVLDQKLLFANEKDKNKGFFVDVKVKSKNKYLLGKLSPDNFKIKHIINECSRDGKTIVTLANGDVEGPDWVQITGISPNEFELNLDEIITKKDVPIIGKFTGELPEGYGYNQNDAKFQSGRDKVDVTGPSKIVKGIKEVHTMPIPLQDATDDFTFVVDLEPQSGIQYSFDKTTVAVKIDKPQPKEFPLLPVKTLMPDAFSEKNYLVTLTPKEISVSLEGNQKDLNKLTSEDIHPYVDISKIDKPGVYDVSVRCWCDNDNVKINLIKPDKVTVRIKEKGVAQATEK